MKELYTYKVLVMNNNQIQSSGASGRRTFESTSGQMQPQLMINTFGNF